jgi:hypothetical protein
MVKSSSAGICPYAVVGKLASRGRTRARDNPRREGAACLVPGPYPRKEKWPITAQTDTTLQDLAQRLAAPQPGGDAPPPSGRDSRGRFAPGNPGGPGKPPGRAPAAAPASGGPYSFDPVTGRELKPAQGADVPRAPATVTDANGANGGAAPPGTDRPSPAPRPQPAAQQWSLVR